MTTAGRPGIVDAHHHVWDLAVRPQPFLDSAEELAPLRRTFAVADLVPLAAAAGVTATVVVQTVTEAAETTELLALARAGPLVSAVVGWTDLTSPGIADALASLLAGPDGQFLAGIRHPLLTEPDPDWLARPEVRRGLAALGVAGLTFDLVLQPHKLAGAAEAAAGVPGLTFVLDHLGNVDVSGTGPDPAWVRSFRAFAAQPNTVGKLSGILSEFTPGDDPDGSVTHLRPYAELALESFGPQRLMFGSDWPVSTLGARYGDVVAAALALIADLSERERAAILSGTAQAIYGVPDPGS
jgi:L-fuconolactonase